MERFAIAAAQSKSVKGDIAANVRHHIEIVDVAAAHQCDAIVFPELSLTGYERSLAAELAISTDDQVLTPLQRAADRTGMTIVAGCPIRSDGSKPFLGAVIVRKNSAVVAYRKRFVTTSEKEFFEPSSDCVVVETHGEKMGAAICADISNSMHAADAKDHHATIYAAGVMMIPEDIGRACDNMAHYAKKHRMLAVMANYASETGGYKTAGKSGVWNTDGNVIAQAPGSAEFLVLACRDESQWAGHVIEVPDS